jgi:hypothetical protein
MWRTLFGNSSNSVPRSGFPHSSKVGSFRYPQMRELRTRERWEAAANALRIQPARLGHPLDRGREDRATTARMRGLCRSRTGFLNDTCLSSRRREAFNAHSQFS